MRATFDFTIKNQYKNRCRINIICVCQNDRSMVVFVSSNSDWAFWMHGYFMPWAHMLFVGPLWKLGLCRCVKRCIFLLCPHCILTSDDLVQAGSAVLYTVSEDVLFEIKLYLIRPMIYRDREWRLFTNITWQSYVASSMFLDLKGH